VAEDREEKGCETKRHKANYLNKLQVTATKADKYTRWEEKAKWERRQGFFLHFILD